MKAGKLLLVFAAVGLLGIGSFALGVKADGIATGATSQGSERPLARFIRGQIGRFMVLRSQLDLSDAQKDQIKTILEAHKAEIVQVIQPIIDKKRALREAVTAPTPDEQAIRNAANDLGKSIGDAAVLASKLKQQISPILTDQQRQDLHDFRSQTDQAVDELMTQVGGQK